MKVLLDAEARNILYGRGLMVVDFKHAELRARPPLGLINANSQGQKRKRGTVSEKGRDDFTQELQSAMGNVSACF